MWVYVAGVDGATATPEEADFSDTMFLVLWFTVPPALAVGLLDGIALASRSFRRFHLRMTSTVMLILLSAFWIVPWSIFAILTDDLLGQSAKNTPRSVELGALAGMEVALAAELTVAILVWLLLGWWRDL